MALIFFVLLFSGAKTEEATPSSVLSPRHFNHHAFAAKYGQEFRVPETTKQGPVLFPNDAPPPPRPPLIVTSRPLLESIARSELNPEPQNNTIPQGTQISSIVKPFLARVKDYRPFAYAIATPPTQDYDYDRYDDYEHQKPVLPPIYKAIADHAKQKVVKIQQQRQKDRYEYQVKAPDYYEHHKSNDIDGHGTSDGSDEQNKNYAFSYRVKDQKTGDDFSHRQHSKGSATNGEYRVRLPDGRMQIVSYTADENGYQADVRYDDEDKTSGNSIDNNKSNYIYNRDDNYQHNNKVRDHHNFDDHQIYDRHNYDYKHNEYDKNKYDHDYSQQSDYKADYRTDVNDKFKSPSSDYYTQYTDGSKEYYNDDFSKEFESKSYDYAPHKSKFASFIADKNANTDINQNLNIGSVSTVKPSYGELKDLLVTKNAYNTVQPSYFTRAPVSINVPSTTPSSLNFGSTTERVVLIGGKKTNFYTNIRNVPLVSTVPVSVTESPIKYGTASDFSISPTPMSYLVSTIASLRNRVDLSGPKPVLSNSYIDRINKYLTFNK